MLAQNWFLGCATCSQSECQFNNVKWMANCGKRSPCRGWHAVNGYPSWAQNSQKFALDRFEVCNVLKYIGREDCIEAVV